MPSPQPPGIPERLAAFLHGGLAFSVASRGPDNVPSVARALGCHLTADQRRLRVLLSRPQTEGLLADFRANGAIALVCTEPSTHRSLQVKGRDAVVEEALDRADGLRAQAHRESFLAEVVPLGYPEALIRTFLACADEDLAAVTFTPTEAYDQTPGLHAGDPLPEGP